MADKALLIVSSHNQLGETGEKTGFWWEELVAPYYEFSEQGYECDIASPQGRQPLADPRSDVDVVEDPEVIALLKRFRSDAEAVRKLANSVRLSEIDPGDYQIVFVVGGHGAMWDLADNPDVKRILPRLYAQGGVVSAVCHGPAAFKGVTLEDGTPLVQGKEVTGFTNEEEQQVGLTEVVPFSLEDMLREDTSRFSAADAWQENVVASHRLVTGQNPMSSRATAKKAVQAARGR